MSSASGRYSSTRRLTPRKRSARLSLRLGLIPSLVMLVGCFSAFSPGRAQDAARAEAGSEAMSALFPTPMWDADAIRRGATIADDLTFPKQAEAGPELSDLTMALLKPAGDG